MSRICRLLSSFMRLWGWEVIGKRILISDAEGPGAQYLRGKYGEIIDASSNDDSPEYFIIKLDSPIRLTDGDTSRIVCFPRHYLFAAQALAITSIRAYAFSERSYNKQGEADWNDMLAIVDIMSI